MSSATPSPPHYITLGVPVHATAAEISKAYRKASIAFHPDRHVGQEQQESKERRFQEIVHAYDVLKDADKRAQYDTQHGVNFRSRVSVLQEALLVRKRARSSPLHEGEQVAQGGLGVSFDDSASISGDGMDHPDEEETLGNDRECESDDDDDDEEYEPAVVLRPPAASVFQHHHHGEADDGVAPSDVPGEADEEGSINTDPLAENVFTESSAMSSRWSIKRHESVVVGFLLRRPSPADKWGLECELISPHGVVLKSRCFGHAAALPCSFADPQQQQQQQPYVVVRCIDHQPVDTMSDVVRGLFNKTDALLSLDLPVISVCRWTIPGRLLDLLLRYHRDDGVDILPLGLSPMSLFHALFSIEPLSLRLSLREKQAAVDMVMFQCFGASSPSVWDAAVGETKMALQLLVDEIFSSVVSRESNIHKNDDDNNNASDSPRTLVGSRILRFVASCRVLPHDLVVARLESPTVQMVDDVDVFQAQVAAMWNRSVLTPPSVAVGAVAGQPSSLAWNSERLQTSLWELDIHTAP